MTTPPTTAPAPPRSRPEEGVCVVPGGYVDDAGVSHREVALRPLSGRDEEYLAALPAETPSAVVVTQLLARAIQRIGTIVEIDAALARKMLVGDREFLTLKLCELTNGDRVYASLQCASAACARPMEVPLTLAGIPIDERPVERRTFVREVEGGRLEFRLPTGDDQEALASRADDPAGADELLRRCIVAVPPQMRFADAARLAEELIEQIAPRIELEIEARCPECGAVASTDVDLMPFVLSELAGDPNGIRHDVHFLAWHYHWPESEILALTRRSRRRYIDLIGDELLRANA
jgi:hypothetical protein